jgi:hypothetical protein
MLLKFVERGHKKGEEKHASFLEEQFENNGSKDLMVAAMQGQVRFGSLLNGAHKKTLGEEKLFFGKNSSEEMSQCLCGLWDHKLLYGIFVVSKLGEQ